MSDHAMGEPAPPELLADNATRYKRDFWTIENLKFSSPWYRLEKAARIISRLADNKPCSLLDIGCGPAALRGLLPSNMEYHGIDIAIHEPAAYLKEVDILESPIAFGNETFDIIVAHGLFEYLGNSQEQKFQEIAELLKPGGAFLVTYTNFAHRNVEIFRAFSNVQSLDDFRESLERSFRVVRAFPASHNWAHSQPTRRVVRAVNMRVSVGIPVVSQVLAVEYFFICRPH